MSCPHCEFQNSYLDDCDLCDVIIDNALTPRTAYRIYRDSGLQAVRFLVTMKKHGFRIGEFHHVVAIAKTVFERMPEGGLLSLIYLPEQQMFVFEWSIQVEGETFIERVTMDVFNYLGDMSKIPSCIASTIEVNFDSWMGQ